MNNILNYKSREQIREEYSRFFREFFQRPDLLGTTMKIKKVEELLEEEVRTSSTFNYAIFHTKVENLLSTHSRSSNKALSTTF